MRQEDEGASARPGRSWPVLLLATGVGAAALSIRRWLLPFGSLNRDESSYAEFAAMLRTGALTLDPAVHQGLQPWASGVVDGRIVLKYSPVWPTVLAVADLVGVRALASAVAGAATVLLVHAVSSRMAGAGERRPVAAFASAAFVALSPFLLVQSATDLSYVFQLVIGLAAGWLILTGERPRSAVGGGILAGLAAFARPFDALLLIGPFVSVTALDRGRRGRLIAGLAGVLPGAFVAGAYHVATMGRPWRLPFTVTGPSDTFGFGRRGVFPDATVPFGLADGLTAAVRNGGWLVAWVFGGPVLVGLAVVGFRRLPPSPVKHALTAIAVLYPLGYIGFWASHAMVDHWRGAASLGPYYHLPVLVPLVVFAGHGFAAIPRRVRTGVGVSALLLTVAWLPPKIAENRRATDTYAAAARAARLAPAPAVLLAPDRGRSGFVSWTPFLHNRPDLDQPVLYADDAGPSTLALLDRHPGRGVARLVPIATAIKPETFRLEVVERRRLDGPLAVTLRGDGPPGRTAYLVDGQGDHRRSLDGGAARWSPSLVQAEGQFAVGIEGRNGRVEVRVPWRRRGTIVEVLLPGAGYVLEDGVWAAGDVSRLLDVEVEVDQGV